MVDYSFFALCPSSKSLQNEDLGLFSNFDFPFELAEKKMDDYSFELGIDSQFVLKSQILTSQKVIDMISCVDEQNSQIPLRENESLSFIQEENKNSIDQEDSRLNNFSFDFSESQTMNEISQQYLSSINNNISQTTSFENINTEEPYRHYPEITKKEIQKAPFNFGKTAIGTYMMKLIKKGKYDKFLKLTLKLNDSLIKHFQEFCCKVSYKTRNDFKFVWSFNGDFESSHYNGLYSFFIVLKKVTKEFLKTDVFTWIEKRTKRKDYSPIYRRCVQVYTKGLENIENFDFEEFFSHPLSYFINVV